MIKGLRLALLLAMAATLVTTERGVAQEAGSTSTLRRQVEERFDILPLHDGIALHPKGGGRGVRSIEITDGTISIDGVPATGAELRDKLGADADLVLRISYLDPDARRALAGEAVQTPEREPGAEPAPPEPPAPPSPRTRPHRTRRSDERVRIGGSVVVEPDEVVTDVVVIGGSARIDGQVLHDVVVVGGTLDIGPNADIGNEATVVGGTAHRDPGAHIGGRLSEVGPGIGLRGLHLGRLAPFVVWSSLWGGMFSLMSTLMRCAVLCILASLALLLGHDYVERVGARAAAEPLKAGIVGFLAQLLLLPALVIVVLFLVITVIGIPLLVLVPFALLALAVVFVVGFTAVVHDMGTFVSTRWGSTRPNPYVTAIVGILVVMSPVLVGRIVGLGGGMLFPITGTLLFIGFCAEYVAWTVGFGAVALSRFDRRPPQQAPVSHA